MIQSNGASVPDRAGQPTAQVREVCTPLSARVCQRCGKPMGVFAHTLYRDGKPERGYYHPSCFTKEKRDAGK